MPTSTGTDAKFGSGLRGALNEGATGFGGNSMTSKDDEEKMQQTDSGSTSLSSGRKAPAASAAGGCDRVRRRRSNDPNSMMSRIVAACAGLRGANQREIREATGGATELVSSLVPQLVRLGRVFKVGPKMKHRYFASQEVAVAWLKDHAEPERAAELERQRLARNVRRRKNKAEYSKRHYAEKRAKLGLAVKPRKPTGSPDIPTTPKKAKTGEPGRGRGIVIGKPKAFTVVTAQDKAKPTTKHSGEPINPNNVQPTICLSGTDRRFVFEPPPGWRGVVDAAECRPWAAAVAEQTLLLGGDADGGGRVWQRSRAASLSEKE